MLAEMLLIVHTARHRYAVRRTDVSEIKFVGDSSVMPCDERGQPYIGVELGPVLDPGDQSAGKRRHALIVLLRRRRVALLAERIESFQEQAGTVALPELFKACLEQPWAIGALVIDGEVVVQLDLLAVARSALAQHKAMEPG